MVCSEPGGQKPVLSLSLDLIKVNQCKQKRPLEVVTLYRSSTYTANCMSGSIFTVCICTSVCLYNSSTYATFACQALYLLYAFVQQSVCTTTCMSGSIFTVCICTAVCLYNNLHVRVYIYCMHLYISLPVQQLACQGLYLLYAFVHQSACTTTCMSGSIFTVCICTSVCLYNSVHVRLYPLLC